MCDVCGVCGVCVVCCVLSACSHVGSQTVWMINNMIIETTQFLNRFSYLCEQKLLQVNRDLQRVENTLKLLEV